MKSFSFSLFSILLLFSTGIVSQETSLLKGKVIRLDSANKNILPSHIHANQIDSLKRVWQQEQARRRSILREKFLADFDQFPDSLRILRMSKLDLEEMPDISRFKQLKKLYADGNKFTKIPKSVFSSDSLWYVNLSGNPIKRLRISRNKNVVSINMEACNLTRIPFSVRKAKNLKSIYLNSFSTSHVFKANNGIERIPRFLKRMDSLAEINLNYNQIELNKFAVKRLQNIKLILLAGNDLDSLPENIGQLKNVRRLNLSKNNLSELPASFSELDSLKGVIFYENNFSTIPLEVTELKSLKDLDFYYNNIDEIPVEIALLQNLERLYLSFSNISVLPDAMRSMKNLKRLYIHHNELIIIPGWITEIDSLEVLDVGYNKLIDFPDVSEMPKLYEVDIQENAIGEIPWKLATKKNLKLLLLKNNLFLEDEDNISELKKLEIERAGECVIVID